MGELRESAHFAGRLNRSRPNHLVSGDVFCTPCNRASFGMVLLEAMSCGRPVVASRISGFQLVMRDGVHGYMIEPADSAELFAAALGRLLDSEADRVRMGAAGAGKPSSATPGPGRRPARDLLHRPDRRPAAIMGKRQTLTIYGACAVVVIVVAAIVGEQLEKSRKVAGSGDRAGPDGMDVGYVHPNSPGFR